MPIPSATAPEVEAPTPLPALLTTQVPEPTNISGPELPYAVVWVEAGEPLTVRQPAGITSMEVDSLAPNQRGLTVTGKTSQLGSSTWVEINIPNGGKGWVNDWNLTEDVSISAFCNDARVAELANQFILGMKDRDGGKLSELASPKRGLIIRHDWWNPEVLIGPDAVKNLFDAPQALYWGVIRDSEVTIDGTFNEVILPQLEDVFTIAPEQSCNELAAGSSAEEILWPPEYSNLNYLAFYRPAPEPGSQLNWRSWVLGIEYVKGEPYLAVLVQYRGEI